EIERRILLRDLLGGRSLMKCGDYGIERHARATHVDDALGIGLQRHGVGGKRDGHAVRLLVHSISPRERAPHPFGLFRPSFLDNLSSFELRHSTFPGYRASSDPPLPSAMIRAHRTPPGRRPCPAISPPKASRTIPYTGTFPSSRRPDFPRG